MVCEYDIIVVGGGIAGSIISKELAKECNVLMVEKHTTPRHKACSGIQFSSFEKLIGEKIPPHILCNDIEFLEIINPQTNFKFISKYRMLNFMRNEFDSWLNKKAMEKGVTFKDGCIATLHEEEESYSVSIKNKHTKESEHYYPKIIIDAGGINSSIYRSIYCDEEYCPEKSGGSLNLYLEKEESIPDDRLYQIYDDRYNDLMFSWIYTKYDHTVIGGGYSDETFIQRVYDFLEYCKKEYDFKGTIVRKEGFKALSDFTKCRTGYKNVLCVGDSAGLVDLYRGVGMDVAAISAIKCANAIKKNVDYRENGKKWASLSHDRYKKSMKKIIMRNVKILPK